MVTAKRLGGIGAIGSASSRFFHPGDRVREHYPTDTRMRVTGAVITGEGQRKVRHEMKLCYLVSIPDVDGECYIVKKNFRVDVSPEVPFKSEDARPVARAPRPDLEGVDRAALNNIVPNVRVGPGLDETIAELWAEGVEADDDNEPLEEGAADPPAPPDVQHTFSVPTHCPRRTLNLTDDRGKWAHHRWDEIAEYTEMKLFRMAFPEEWIETVLIPTTNGHLTNRMTLGEFYKWLGCNFFMACFQGISDRESWWSKSPVSMYDGAPFRLGNVMSLYRYKEITMAIRFTDKAAPTLERDGYVDRFHEVRNMLDVFNEYYASNYHPSWLNVLDESMSSWLSKFCPGFMCVPRKPHPFGNEYHSIADGDDGKPIMWRVKLVEGKDRPKKADGQWVFPTEYPGLGKTTTTMLEMTKPIHGKGKVVVGDSGFCVREGVIECHKRGVWFQAYVKKRGNWPRGVPGEAIDRYFDDLPLGHCESLVAEYDNIEFRIHCCRDSKYVSKIMSTHGMLETREDHPTYRKVDGSWKTFKYTEPFSRYSRAKHWVDDVNNRRHDPIGLEEVWGTKWWAMRQFTFLCSVAEVNAVQSRARGRNKVTAPQLDFHRKLAQQMMENTIDEPVVPQLPAIRTRRPRSSEHKCLKQKRGEGMWDFSYRRFKCVASEYVRLRCHCCRKKFRT